MKIKSLLFTFFCIIHVGANAQLLNMYDPVTNKVFNGEKYAGFKGSPYLFDKWMSGTIKTKDGSYEIQELKLDVYDNKIYYNKADQVFEVSDDVLHLVIYPKANDKTKMIQLEKGYISSGLNKDQYVELLSNGKIKLLKSEIKALSEVNEINVGVVKAFSSIIRYYINKDKSTQLIKLNKSEILTFFKEKEAELTKYIDENKLNLKKEEDCIKLIGYYNSIE